MVLINLADRKSTKMQCKIVILYVFLLFYLVHCDGITIRGAKCGVKICKLSEYCRSHDNTCQPCNDICDSKTHNYEEETCEKECQGK